MDQELKQRLIGASVIIALAIIFVPMLFDGDGVKQQNQNISIEIPDSPSDLEVKTFEIDKPVTDQKLNLPEGDVTLAQQNVSTAENQKQQSVVQPVLIDKAEEEKQAEEQTARAVVEAEPDPVVEVEAKPDTKVTQKNKQNETTVKPAAEDKPKRSAPVEAIGLAYRVKLGSFSKQANAQKVKTQLLQKKIRSLVEKDATRNLYHVWSADMYQSKSKAEVYVKAVNALKLNIGQPSVQSMDAKQVDALAQTGQLGWVVQLGSFSAKDNAIELRNKVKAAGFSGFVDRIKNSKGENRFRLRVGPLMEKADAQKAQADISNRLRITGLIKTHEPGLPVES
ncbi:SPOR domain-containing protein [Marinicella rhabdoformis]|uniref:SPOR domain-containing protein n=1 Tax=Marinicella rhabdoformis TaxID=2580566 RepID=UPI0012AED24A|nr:SPOR domain-containing protein [Marinicella rhabdoformis]